MDRLMEYVTYVLLLVASMIRMFPVNGSLRWTSEPDEIVVLQMTRAVFNWKHGIHPPLDITWDYKGTDSRPVLDLIMDYTTGAGVYIPIQDQWHGRVGYDQSVTGSAIMTLDNVTSADEKYYEVNVKNLDNQSISLTDQASITVIYEEDIRLSVTLNNMTFDISVDQNGTDIILPDIFITDVQERVNIAVDFEDSSPKPREIEVQNRLGPWLLNDHSCVQAYPCDRHIHFITPDEVQHTANVTVSIAFDVQNLDEIKISQIFHLPKPEVKSSTAIPTTFPVTEHEKDTVPPKICDDSGQRLIIVVLCCVIVVLFILLVISCTNGRRVQSSFGRWQQCKSGNFGAKSIRNIICCETP